jgi:hypothetical protein
MTCIQAQSLITPFINNNLNLKETEEFLKHIDSCQKCREELEFYFVLLTAMKQLDEDKNLSNDFHVEFIKKLERSREKILHAKYKYFRKKAILLLTIILLAFLVSFRYAYIAEEKENAITVSTFRLKMSFREDRDQYLEEQLKRYLNQQVIDKNKMPIEKNMPPEGLDFLEPEQ